MNGRRGWAPGRSRPEAPAAARRDATSRLLRALLFVLLLGTPPARCLADPPASVVKLGKEATALVEVKGGRGYGSAFCIRSEGLFVTSAHLVEAVTEAETYRYQIDVKSRRGGVQLKLDAGPPGMRLSPKGLLEWKVPDDYGGKQESIIVTIRGGAAREAFHAFMLQVPPGGSDTSGSQ